MLLWLAVVLASQPPLQTPEPEPLSLRPRAVEVEVSRGVDRPGPRMLPDPPPDLAGHHQKDEVRITIAADGTAKATMPRSVRGALGVCAIGLCVSTRGVRSAPDRKRPIQFATAPVLVGFAGAFGYQPPSSNAASAMLRDTSDQRAQQAIRWQRQALGRARLEIGSRLAAILRDPSHTAWGKRRIVFELWDDAMVTAAAPVADGDELALARVSAARDIADAIVRFVRLNMPAGSELGYDADELAALDRTRQSPHPFEPYDAARAPTLSLR